MISRLSSTALTQMIPLLGSLARLIARGAPLSDQDLQMLLMGADLESDSVALAEIQRWSRLLSALYAQPTPTVRHVTVETLLLRGVPEASAMLAVATIVDRATAVLPTAPATLVTDPRLQASVAQLDFGTLSPDQPVSTEFEIQGGPGQIIVESDYVRVTPTQFDSGTTRVRIEVMPLAGGLLWTDIKLVTASETVDVPVMAQWNAVAIPQVDATVRMLPDAQSQVTELLTNLLDQSTPVRMLPDAQSQTAIEQNTSQQAVATIVVTPGVSEEESGVRLADALAAAPPGAEISLLAGTYRLTQPFVIDKPLTLTGEGMDCTRLCCAAEGWVARFVGDGPFVIAAISFEHTGTAWARVVEVTGGEIDFQRCRFIGGVSDEVGQRGGSGLYVCGHTLGVVAQCEAVSNGTGIYVADHAQPLLEANTCKENKRGGITYEGSARGKVIQNKCVINGQNGIFIGEHAQPILEANICQQNKWPGIGYAGNAGGSAIRNTCSYNEGNGIVVMDHAQPMLEANICQRNRFTGIAYTGCTVGTARQNTCTGNEQSGISVREQAQPTLEANTCQENKGCGILYEGSAAGMAYQNTCVSNEQHGIFIGQQSQPTLEANSCQQNRRTGIAYTGSAVGTALQNMCMGNEQSGISVGEQSRPTLQANICKQNAGSGVVYTGSARGTAILNTCHGNSNTFANYPVSESTGSGWIRPSPATCARSRRNKPGSGFSGRSLITSSA